MGRWSHRSMQKEKGQWKRFISSLLVRPLHKKRLDRGETMELPRNEAQYLVNLGKAKLIEVEKSSYEKRTSKKKA